VRHRVHDDPYVHVGRQDLTAHVDVSAVERAAVAAGLDHLGTTTQAEFLVGLGTEDLLQAIQADPATTLEDYLAVRSALMRLLDPSAMGRFRVMAFARDWPVGPPLAGLGYRLGAPATGRPPEARQ
jgi:SAM-dependent MidA family methyltransferase